MNQNSGWNRLYQVGGISLILIGVVYTLIFVTYAIVQPDFESGLQVAALAYLTEPLAFVLPITLISSVGGILYLPAILGLYFLLRQINPSLMVIALGLTLIMIPLILAQNIFNVAIMSISNVFVAADNEILKSAYLGAATITLSAVFGAEIFIVILFSIATILISCVMLQGRFGTRTAYWGLVTGIINFIGQLLSALLGNNHPVVLTLVFIGLLFNIIWFVLVGYKLYTHPFRPLLSETD